ncbi:MAG: Nif3-like dinuclear metal center hexameric protein [Peptostreptococcaceae bacterium]
MILVKDILEVLDKISNGRCVKSSTDFSTRKNPFVVTKSSDIPGKAVTEMPGLVCGNPDMKVNKIAVTMTLTECAIELAAQNGVDAIIAHHPISDASSCGGVLLKNYLELYNIAVFELHEAFHGLHPGIPWLHGHKVVWSDINYGGIKGNIVYVGETLECVNTLGDILNRLNTLMGTYKEACFEKYLLEALREYKRCNSIYDTSISLQGEILVGNKDSIVKKLIHVFPHTGFTAEHLEKIVEDFPDVDTLLVSISRVYDGNPLIDKVKELGLNLICGNSHTIEIYENGIPLARAIKDYLPEIEVEIFREIITSIPLDYVSTKSMRKYGEYISREYLHR